MNSKDVQAIFQIRKARAAARDKDPRSAGEHIWNANRLVGVTRVQELSKTRWVRI